MTVLDINTHNRLKLSMYLCKHLENKRYEKVRGIRSGNLLLSFTYEEAREALMKAMDKAIRKKDIKIFLHQLRLANGGYGASDASEKILKELTKTP